MPRPAPPRALNASAPAPGPGADPGSGMTGRVCVGVISGVHGVRGLVRVKPFTADPADVTAYGPVTDKTGRPIRLALQSLLKGQWLVRIDGVADRTAAEALKGTELFVARDRLPPPEDEDDFYHADLLGLTAHLTTGTVAGRVRAVLTIGETDVLEILPQAGGSSLLVPFTKANVPTVDLAGGRLVIDPPEPVDAGPEDGPEDGPEPGDG